MIPLPNVCSHAPTRLRSRVFSGALASVAFALSSSAVVFNFSPAPGTPVAAIAGFQAAGARWSSLLGDNVTININIAFTTLAPTVLGSTSSSLGTISYNGFRSALNLDRTSSLDNTAVANLPLGSFGLMINHNSDNVNGFGSAVPMLDNDGSLNNTSILTTSGNAKALGLLPGNNAAVDASISFNSSFSWDFNLSDGLAFGTRDFVGVATHEIGHALGFGSGVDFLDGAVAPVSYNSLTRVMPLDLFRVSTLSLGNNAIDWTADTNTKFFSVDRGLTMGPTFSTGITFGDGRQASHWKDSLGLGIMDPTIGAGEIVMISQNDLRAMDAIGWNLVPDDGSAFVQLGIGLAVLSVLGRLPKSGKIADGNAHRGVGRR